MTIPVLPISRAHFALAPRGRFSTLWHATVSRLGAPRDFSESLEQTSESDSSNGRRLAPSTTRPEQEKDISEEMEEENAEIDMVVVDGKWENGVSTKPVGTYSSSAHGKDHTAKSDDASEVHALSKDHASSNFLSSTKSALVHFFSPHYNDPAEEERYQRELWIESKPRAIAGGLFLLIIWALAFALPRPWSIVNMVSIYGFGPFTVLPLLPFVLFDIPRTHPRLWQSWLLLATWQAPICSLLDLRICGFYDNSPNCGNRDFQGILFFCAANFTIGLFSLGARRCYSLAGACTVILIAIVAIVPVRLAYLRNIANIIIFLGFVLYLSFSQDISSRRVWTLRAELKVQFRAKQRAQISERKSSESKRRFTAYIFHEVRVPLNTATIACNLLEDFITSPESATEFGALKGSLAMMSQVLNDVLDFTRMERGGFSSVSKPMSLHQTIRGISNSLQLDTVARGLTLETTLDPRIDEVLKFIAHPDSEDELVEEGEGIVLGDEMRLRQVINNLTSNAAKFTAPGGKVSIVTKLLYPSADSVDLPLSTPASPTGAKHPYEDRLSTQKLALHERRLSPARKHVVVRLEVSDTGVGIQPKDLVDQRLFSAYVQTTAGKMQGGKGSGLGLSLVRNIVMLQGGRLGVKSKFGVGSTFWVELSFPVPVDSDNGSSRSSDQGRASQSYELLSTGGTVDSEQTDFKFGNAKFHERRSETRAVEFTALPILSSSYRLPSAQDTVLVTTPRSPPTQQLPPAPIVPYLDPLPIPATPIEEVTNPLEITSVPRSRSNTTPNASLKPSASITARAAAIPISFGPAGPLLCLVVDDDALTRRLMSRLLTRLGCICTTAENGKIALEFLLEGDKKNFDITFLDNQMPLIPGTEVVRRIRSIGRDDLIVGVTANALRDDQEAYLDCGASFVLTKPVVEADLRRMLEIAVERRAAALALVDSTVSV